MSQATIRQEGPRQAGRESPGWPVWALVLGAAGAFLTGAVAGAIVAGVAFAGIKSAGMAPGGMQFVALLRGEGGEALSDVRHGMTGVLVAASSLTMIAAAFWLGKRAVAGGRARALAFTPAPGLAMAGAVAGMPVLFLASFLAVYAIAGIEVPSEAGFTLSRPAMWVYGISLVVLAPAAEEMTFRGWLFAGLADRLGGAVPVIVLTGILWALIHGEQGGAKVVALVPIGLALGYIRHKADSLWPTLAGHMAMNATGLLYMSQVAG